MTLEEIGFSFDYLCKNNAPSLFGFHSSSSNNFHVLTMSCHNLVTRYDASCWLTTCGGKMVKWPFVFKLTQQHANNWEVGMLLLQCIIFPTIDVLPPRYGWIYNILSNDKQYDITIGNFHGCSCVFFVTMLADSLGGHGAYVQCKHVYHIL
jgi:hypothetical protein